MTILILQEAEAEYTSSLRWYAERSKSAALALEAEFSLALDAIAVAPERYPKCDDRHRFFLMKRFPFQIIYRPLAEGQLLIVAIAHSSRRPGYWSGRSA